MKRLFKKLARTLWRISAPISRPVIRKFDHHMMRLFGAVSLRSDAPGNLDLALSSVVRELARLQIQVEILQQQIDDLAVERPGPSPPREPAVGRRRNRLTWFLEREVGVSQELTISRKGGSAKPCPFDRRAIAPSDHEKVDYHGRGWVHRLPRGGETACGGPSRRLGGQPQPPWRRGQPGLAPRPRRHRLRLGRYPRCPRDARAAGPPCRRRRRAAPGRPGGRHHQRRRPPHRLRGQCRWAP